MNATVSLGKNFRAGQISVRKKSKSFYENQPVSTPGRHRACRSSWRLRIEDKPKCGSCKLSDHLSSSRRKLPGVLSLWSAVDEHQCDAGCGRRSRHHLL